MATMTLILDIEYDPEEAARYVGARGTKANPTNVAQYIANSIGSGGIGHVDVYRTRKSTRKGVIAVGDPI